jgi:hypothetical protein
MWVFSCSARNREVVGTQQIIKQIQIQIQNLNSLFGLKNTQILFWHLNHQQAIKSYSANFGRISANISNIFNI